MLRSKNVIKNNKEQLEFQIIDWASSDTYLKINDDDDDENENENQKKKNKKRRLVLRGHGITSEGNSISIHIFNFKPYFYIKLPQNWDERIFRTFKNACMNQIPEYQHDGLVDIKMVKRKDFYGFTNNKLFKFGLFIFKNQGCYYSFRKLFNESKIQITRLNQEFDFSKKMYETKVSPLLRFFHNNELQPSSWIKIPANQYKLNIPKQTRSQIDISVDAKNVLKSDLKQTPQIIVASFDIECTSCDGAFPKFSRQEDRVIQIGTSVYIYGKEECALRYVSTLKKSDPIENTIVECFETERELLIGWAKFIEKLDPDIMTGYNIWGFDWEYIYERAKMENCCHQLFRHLNKVKNVDQIKQELTIQDLSSSALGQNILKYILIEGVVQIDLLKVVQRDHKLDSYKLDNVSKVFMGQQKVDLSPSQLFENYKEGSSKKIQEIAIYCIKDCVLVNELINKLQVITNNMGMSNVCIVPFSYLFMRGQGIKIFSLVAKFCNDENFIIKDLNSDDIDTNSYEGAIVFVPKPGVYFEPVVVMDYNSLYPSSMIAENISHDSILGFKEYAIKDDKSFELVKDTINQNYNNLDGYHYIDIEYDIFQGLDDEKKKVGYKVCTFAEPDNGDKSVLPRILRKLLKARKDTRKMMKYKTIKTKEDVVYEGLLEEKDDHYEVNNLELGIKNFSKESVVSIGITNNEFQIAVLDGLQLAYKVTCNSLYGQVGATTSPICYKELAACTTSTGRRMVVVARDLTLEKFEGSQLTYGDSVADYSPVYIRYYGKIMIMAISELAQHFGGQWEFCKNSFKRYCELKNVETWSDKGWTPLHRVIKHKLPSIKKMYRVHTHRGIIDVTDDHSCLTKAGKEISPVDIDINTELCHFPLKEEIDSSTNSNEHVKMAVQFHKCYDKYSCISLTIEEDGFHTGFIEGKSDHQKALSVSEIDYDGDVYDLTTENHHFAAGIGHLIVHNTDSIFVNFSDTIRKRNPEKNFTEKELLEQSIVIGEEAAEHINSHMKAPQNIEYEKTFWPFCIFSKKRYFGNKYEFDIEKYKQTSMGIVLKRRDNAPIVKTIYGGVIDIILNQRNVEDSKKYFKRAIEDLLDGNVDISQLVVSKTVKNDYSNPTLIAHKVLADRMGERDPGNKPQSNDRIPYCYIESKNLKCTICNADVNPDKCKCVNCMNIYCYYHLGNHKEDCHKICRFCRKSDAVIIQEYQEENRGKLSEHKKNELCLKRCNTCFGNYCKGCFEKHNIRKDKYKVLHNDKCKKPLSSKLLQGDIIEHPSYITENKLKIDYNYYLTNQIEKPVFQIFELVMKNPKTIIEDVVRKQKNKKNGNASIKMWFKAMNQNVKDDTQTKPKLKEKVDYQNIDEDDNLLDGFEEEPDKGIV